MKSRAATSLLHYFGRAARAVPYNLRGRGRLAIALTSLLLKSGADPIVHCNMAAGHRLRLDCRIPNHCWTFFSGKYEDETLLSFLRPGGVILDVGANIGFYTVPMAIRAKALGSRVVAIEPLASNADWLRYNLALNGCSDVTEVLEVALGNECGRVEMVLTEDFLGGAVVGTATIGSRELYGPQYARTEVQLETLDRIWRDKARIDVIKVDIDGHETKFLEGGRKTIAAHRPVLLMELDRVHQQIRGINADIVVPSLLPGRYIFAELGTTGFVQIDNLGERTAADFLAIPEERRYEVERAYQAQSSNITFFTSPKRAVPPLGRDSVS